MNVSAIALGITIAAIAVSSGIASAGNSDVQCGIARTSQNGMLSLEGSLTSPVPLSGEYRFAIKSASNGGSSNISQGGHFTANANEKTTLGKVMLNSGASYDVVLDITANGKNIECNQDIASLL